MSSAKSVIVGNLQIDIFPIEAPRKCADNGAEASSAELLHRAIAFADGRQIFIGQYKDESQLSEIMALIGSELSEPYSIYTYRYFIHYWPELCILAHEHDRIVGVIIGKLEQQQQFEDSQAVQQEDYVPALSSNPSAIHSKGYIAMLAVADTHRAMGLGTRLVRTVLRAMEERGCDEVILETEVSNARSLSLYGRLGFVRESRLFRYYLNGSDAFRLKLYLDKDEDRPGANYEHQHENDSTAHLLSTISAIMGTKDWMNDEERLDRTAQEMVDTKEGPSTSSTHL